jgi:plastocyanin
MNTNKLCSPHSHSWPFVAICGSIFSSALWTALLLLFSTIAGLGCDSGTAAKDTLSTAPPTAWGTATIRGDVHFIGKPPLMRMLSNQPCCENSTPIPEESVVVGNKGGMANVFVFLVDAPASDGKLPPATLDQKNCRFVPHGVGVNVGQTLVLQSQDPTMHTVTYSPTNNPPKEFSLTFPGAKASTTFIAPEFVHARCDIHPWMNATIGVFANPFFAVTSADGSFEIPRVPAGHYKIAAWQERYGQSPTQEITVENGTPVQVNFNFQSP